MVSEYIVRRRRGQRNSSRALLVSLCCFVLSFDSFASLAKAASDNPSPVTTTTPTTQPQIQTASSISTTPATQPSIENGASHSSEGRMFGLKTLGKLVKGSIGAKGGIESEESELNAEGDESNSFDASIGFENQSKSSSSSSNNNNNNNNDEEEDNSSSEIKGIATDLEAIESDIEDITAHVPQVKHSIKHKHHVPHHNNHGYNFNYGQQAGFQQPGYQPEYQQGYQPAFQQGYQQGYQPAYQSAYQPAYKPTHQQGEVYGDEGDFEVGASNQHHHSKKPKSHPKKKAKSVKYKPIKGDDKVIIFKVDEKDHHQQQQCEVKSFHLKGREIIANLMQFIRLKREKVQNIGFGLLKPLQVIGKLKIAYGLDE